MAKGVLDLRIEAELKKGILAGFPIKDQTAATNWFKNKIKQGFSFELISQKLRKHKYNLNMVDKVLQKGEAEAEAETAMQQVKTLETKLATQKEKEKEATRLGWLIAAIMTCGIAAYIGNLLKKTMEDISTEAAGMGGSFISIITKTAWLICILSAIVALALIIWNVHLWKKKSAKKKEVMGKKGQIFILIAVILCVAIFGLVTIANRTEQTSTKSDFEKLSQNYATESARLINSLINKPGITSEEIGNSFTEFTILFTGYSKTQTPGFQLIYALNYENTLYLGNYMDRQLGYGGAEPLEGCYDMIPASITFQGASLAIDEIEIGDVQDGECVIEIASPPGDITFTIDSIPYLFKIKPNQPEVILVSMEEIGEQTKIYLHGTPVTPGD